LSWEISMAKLDRSKNKILLVLLLLEKEIKWTGGS